MKTVRVKSTDPASQGPYVLMNEGDFDPQIHALYEDELAEVEADPEPDQPRRRGRPRKNEGVSNGDR